MPQKQKKTEQDHLDEARSRLLDAALVNVPFDGWSDQTFQSALGESGVDAALAKLSCPRGVLDLACAFHHMGDAALLDADLAEGLRYSERVSALVFARIMAIPDRETARASATFFAMPAHISEGAGLVWATSDAIWQALGDTSRDVNWYSKRAILAGVYSATFLYWLGDESEGCADTRAFIERRIGNVMTFEKVKSKVRKLPFYRALTQSPAGRIIDKITAPGGPANIALPGSIGRRG